METPCADHQRYGPRYNDAARDSDDASAMLLFEQTVHPATSPVVTSAGIIEKPFKVLVWTLGGVPPSLTSFGITGRKTSLFSR